MHARPIHHDKLPHRAKHPTTRGPARRRSAHPHRRSASQQIIMILTQHSSATKSPLPVSISSRILATLRTLCIERLRLRVQLRRTSVELSRLRVNLRELALTPLPVTHHDSFAIFDTAARLSPVASWISAQE